MSNEKIMVRLMVRCALWSEKYGNFFQCLLLHRDEGVKVITESILL